MHVSWSQMILPTGWHGHTGWSGKGLCNVWYAYLCVCVCVCVCMHACVHACMRVCMCVCVNTADSCIIVPNDIVDWTAVAYRMEQ